MDCKFVFSHGMLVQQVGAAVPRGVASVEQKKLFNSPFLLYLAMEKERYNCFSCQFGSCERKLIQEKGLPVFQEISPIYNQGTDSAFRCTF